jgi:hypothetical protein
MRAPVLGSMLTRQYRLATRAIGFTLRTARQAVDIAGGVVVQVADRFGLHDDQGEDEVVTGTVVPEAEPRPEPPEPRPAPPVRPPEPPRAAAAAPPPEPEPPAHVSTEPELVSELADPGAEDGAGAQVRVMEPWPGYRHLKARDVIARLPSATREELAAVELFELAGANRKSVVVAAQRALKKASPPR